MCPGFFRVLFVYAVSLFDRLTDCLNGKDLIGGTSEGAGAVRGARAWSMLSP